YPPNGWTSSQVSAPLWETLRREARSFETIGASTQARVSLREEQGARRVRAALVSHDLFAALGIAPQMGRLFGAADDLAPAPRVALLSDRLWRSRFGGDPAVLGRYVTVDGARAEIVGVMPPGFQFPETEDLW